MATPLIVPRILDWGAAAMPAPGETECGDRYVVERFERGAMVAMIDALGHGHEAAQTAAVAAQALSLNPRASPADLMQRCHAEMRGTRGAALSIAIFDAIQRTLTWLGVGNVTGTLVSAGASPRARQLVSVGGVVGDRLPDLRPSVVPVAAGDTLILTTDGVGPYSDLALPATIDPQWLADRILGRFAKRTDDAAVLVLCMGGDA